MLVPTGDGSFSGSRACGVLSGLEPGGFSDPWDGFLPSGAAAGGVDTTLPSWAVGAGPAVPSAWICALGSRMPRHRGPLLPREPWRGCWAFSPSCFPGLVPRLVSGAL